eukprot:TRINITY_DN10238_c0_g1_i4.p1 TRINITY_DN10238_c0_g1~~TRINITY_DN10238_c0_g1_i4.p1  ORF type:complete len:386 (+),score=113.82 TRINITY_DN10238_c0_g1_i4:53-1210(+)
MMKAILLNGKPETRSDITKYLSVSESVPKPSIKPNEVLVRVKASAMNIEDIMIGVGRMLVSITATKEAPVVLGQEFSGVVEDVGSDVKEVKQGDKVFGHKFGMKIRFGSWAEFVSVNEKVLVKMGDNYSFAEAAALPMSALVAYGAAMATGLMRNPLLENIPHKTRNKEDVIAVKDVDNEALIMDTKIDKNILKDTKVALVGASSTIGLMVLDMLASRGVKVVGVSSSSSAAPVLANGAVAVLDRHVDGGLGRKGDMQLDIVIDCIGGQEIEDSARKALGSRGHFITVVGPGETSFAEGMVGVAGHLGHAASLAGRAFKSMFSNTKYTLATMPLSGGVKILQDLMNENLKSVIDSEVDMFNEDSVHKAVEKVNNHKNKGRLVFIS